MKGATYADSSMEQISICSYINYTFRCVYVLNLWLHIETNSSFKHSTDVPQTLSSALFQKMLARGEVMLDAVLSKSNDTPHGSAVI